MIILLFVSGVFFGDAYADSSAASLSPTRIAIAANERSASVTLRNTSKTEVAYRMDLIEMGLNANGLFGALKDDELHPEQRSAKKIVRFSPRQVRLKPGASQVVRVIVRRGGLAAGEYRSHMRLEALPVLSGSDLLDSEGNNPVLVNSSSSANVGVTIPVIVRHSDTDATVTLEKSTVVLNRSGSGGRVNLQLALSGNRSAFGDFSVSLINGRKEETIAELKGFALYYPYPRENVFINIKRGISQSRFNSNSRIRVKFKNKAADSNKVYWMDEVSVPVIQ